jgi:transaldolase
VLDEFQAIGTVARTVDDGLAEAHEVFDRLAAVGVDMDDVARVLEDEGVASFSKAFDDLRADLDAKAAKLKG